MLIAAAFTIRTLLDPLLGDRSPFLFFAVAVLFAGARFGVKVGLIVTVLSTVVGRWAFLAPRHSFGQMTSDEWTNVSAFIVTSLAMLIFTNQLVRSREAEALARWMGHGRGGRFRLATGEQRLRRPRALESPAHAGADGDDDPPRHGLLDPATLRAIELARDRDPAAAALGHDWHMRRWNGWGDEADDTRVGASGLP